MDVIQYPTLEDVKKKNVAHGKLIAVDRHSSSHGMMMFSGVSDKFTLKEGEGGFVIVHEHKSEMDGTVENIYRADEGALQRISEIAERENLYAWGKMRIDPQKDNRPVVFDYSSSSGITLFTDDRIGNTFSFNCETAKFYGGGKVISEINEIFNSFLTEDRLISQKQTPVTDARVIEMKKMWFPEYKEPKVFDVNGQAADSGKWDCPQCNAQGNEGKFCFNCGQPKPCTQNEADAVKKEAEEWVYNGGDWECPECGQGGNQGKFCLNCGRWRPDLDPGRDKKQKEQSGTVQPSESARKVGIPNGITEMMKAMKLFPEDKPDEQLTALLGTEVAHGRLISFESSSWSNGMSINSHREDSTKAVWADDKTAVTRYIQQGIYDAAVTEFTAGEKAAAELEEFIRSKNLTNLSKLSFDSSKNGPFANMTDVSGGTHYCIVFDDSSVGGRSFEAFTIDPAALDQHGGESITAKLREFTDRLCTESVIVSSRREPPRTGGMQGFCGITAAADPGEPTKKGGIAHTASGVGETCGKWTCSECGYDENTGKFCNNCGCPQKADQS